MVALLWLCPKINIVSQQQIILKAIKKITSISMARSHNHATINLMYVLPPIMSLSHASNHPLILIIKHGAPWMEFGKH